MKATRIPILLLLTGTFLLNTSCDILTKVVSTVDQTGGKLTTEQVAQGLKEALKAGTDAAVKKLNATDGYYLDQIVKINLPQETQELITYARRVPGLDKMIGDVILQINRSAEDAARQAAPIFVNAITSMTIGDAWGILNGADTAATGYLREKTFNELVNLYRPVVRASLDKPIVAGVSASQSWNQLTKRWNQFAGSVAGKLLSVNQINYSLDEYVTRRALHGLFIKVADQEKLIRTDINARTTDLMRRVFGRTNG